MPFSNPSYKKRLATLSMLVGIVIIMAFFYLAAWNPQFTLWLSIFVGIAFAGPFFIIGTRLQRRNSKNADIPFLPPRKDVRLGSGYIAFFLGVLLPFFIFLPIVWLLPPGDDWPNVTLRIVSIVLASIASFGWITLVRKRLLRLWLGESYDSFVDPFSRPEKQKQPKNALEAARIHGELLVLAALMFLAAYCVANFDLSGESTTGGTRRVRGAAILLAWCNENPNTVISFALLIGTSALSLYLYRVVRATIHSSASS